MPTPVDSTHAGQAVYTRRNLALYDLIVLRLSNRGIWRCPTSRLLEHYARHLSANHLDVGVGTGFFLDRSRFPSHQPRLALFDLNADSLSHTAARVKRLQPQTRQLDILAPIEAPPAPFDSIGVNYLLHCLPGPMTHKARAFDHLAPLLAPGATLFGATILGDGVTRSSLARRLMAFYNAKGIFSNEADTPQALERALTERFSHHQIEIVGCVALFSARRE